MRTETKSERITRFYSIMASLGFSTDEATQLRRIEMTLHRWYEQECGDSNAYCSWSIERDEDTGKPFRCIYPHSDAKARREPIADREAGALKRLRAIQERTKCETYVQTDPRGCALYVSREGNGMNESNYSSRGFAVCYA